MKRLLLAAGAVALVLATACASIAGSAYARAPKLVAQLERAGALAYSPADLPRARLCALLVEQDPTFYRHRGIGLADGSPGHTTVTQAVGKFLLFHGFTPGRFRQRKVRLMIASLGVDAALSKDTQLRLFLNRAYFGSANGDEILGFPSAARSFFGKELGEVTDREFLALLAMLDAPNRYHALTHPEANAARAAAIGEKMTRGCGAGCFEGTAPLPCDTGE